MSVQEAVHGGAAVVAVTALVRLLRARRYAGSAGPERFLPAAAAGTAVWATSIVAYYLDGTDVSNDPGWHAALWFPSIAFTSGALLLWAFAFTDDAWQPRTAYLVAWVAVPAGILGVRLVGGTETIFALFVVNTVYCFAVLLGMCAVLARRLGDPSPIARGIVRMALGSSAVILVAESFRLNVTDLVVAPAIAVAAWLLPRHREQVRAKPDAAVLLDDLGALVLVFDRHQRLVDLNAPARLFWTMRGSAPPPRGTTAQHVLGLDLAGYDAVALRLAPDDTSFTGYVQRLPASGSPSRGWLCLLRRSLTDVGGQQQRHGRRTLMSRLPSYDPTTGLLARRAFEQALVEAAVLPGADDVEVAVLVVQVDASDGADGRRRVGEALSGSWSDHAATVAIGTLGGLDLALVVQRIPPAELTTWIGRQRGLGAAVRARVASGSLADVHALVDRARAELSRV